MGNFYDSIPEFLMAWIAEQHCFWVATAPLSADGHVNVSPKGLAGTFKLLGPNACFYQDLSGSGVETISHLRENGRITIMQVETMYYSGDDYRQQTVSPGLAHSKAHLVSNGARDRHASARVQIEVEIHKVGSSCGFSVPYYTWTGDRTLLVERMATREERDLQVCDEQVKNDICAKPTLGVRGAREKPEKILGGQERSIGGWHTWIGDWETIGGLPPHERDAEKDNMRFHQPRGPKWRQWGCKAKNGGPDGSWLAGFVRHASRGV
ncbi:hypothetical protein RhiJN_19817 [Ceratobasidium sp. AG-Ba]|nr:hypothetical protein RhiJN_19817 [Ceratobasidium sp. AG-Ba]